MYNEVAKEAKDKPLLVLPGVEITMPQGRRNIHLIALFAPSNYKNVDTLLTQIGIKHDDRGKANSRAGKTILEALKIIDEYKGIALVAHVDSERGLDIEMDGDTPEKMDILNSKYLHGIEIKKLESLDIPRFEGHVGIQGSDAHCLEHIGSRFTFMKMGIPSFEGLRQAFGDSESRISLSEDIHRKIPKIIGMKCEHGFLNNQTIKFNNQLNCLIGGKGTGKSSVIELIRYCLDALSSDSSTKNNSLEMIENTLRNGKVCLVIETGDKQKYLIERYFDEKPQIYRDDKSLVEMSIEKFRDIFSIEAYSQGELLKIAKSPEEQLEMLDNYLDLDKKKEKEKGILLKLYDNGRQISRELQEIEKLSHKLEELEIVKEQLRMLEKQGVKKKLEEQIMWEKESQIFKSLIDTLQKALDEATNRLETVKDDYLNLPHIRNLDKLPNKKIIKKSLSEVKRAKIELITKITKENEILQLYLQNVNSHYEEWNEKYTCQKENLKQTFTELESEGIEISGHKQYLKLEKKKMQLEEISRKVTEKEKGLKNIKEKRKGLLADLKKARENVFKERKKEIRVINKKLQGSVRIKIQHEGNIRKFEDYLINDVLSSGQLRIYKDDRKKIAQSYHPMELAKLLESENIETLVNDTDIPADTAIKVIELTKDKIYEIQVTKLEDKITIELNDNGWKPVNKCSDGQRCTAILSIGMSERNSPLIIDQPEDSLDNAFIYTNVVKVIRKIKSARQLLIATHNANIPVLGDGELILVMTSNGVNGFVTERGVIDNDKIKTYAQAILEGGKEAFQKRRLKYGF